MTCNYHLLLIRTACLWWSDFGPTTSAASIQHPVGWGFICDITLIINYADVMNFMNLLERLSSAIYGQNNP